MSWDVWLIRTKTNSEAYEDIREDDYIPISKEEVISVWKMMEKKMHVSVQDIDSHYPHMRGNGWSIEAVFYQELDSSIELQVRGTVCPSEALCMMADLLKARAFDTTTDRFFSAMEPTDFYEWKSVNQKAYHEVASKGDMHSTAKSSDNIEK